MSSGVLAVEPFPVDATADADRTALIALAGLPGLAPSRLWSLLALGSPTEVWQRVAAGGAPRHGRARDAANNWARWAARVDVRAGEARHRHAGVKVIPFGSAGYPPALLDDPDPPAVLFVQGPADFEDRTRVAIVGTRACSSYGHGIATELGRGLAERGVDVVSGLASGIDAAAHAGAASSDSARLMAVVAGGVDVIYPPHNRGLYAQVAADGALISEWPLGSRPERWRFPARNRLVAALCAAVVVVESAAKGGSMYTVDEALQRNRAVFAVPGSIYSPVSFGTNKLIADGAHSLHDLEQLFDTVAPRSTTKPAQLAFAVDSWLLDAIGWEPASLDAVVRNTGRSPSEVTLEVERLIAQGHVRRRGSVIERRP